MSYEYEDGLRVVELFMTYMPRLKNLEQRELSDI